MYILNEVCYLTASAAAILFFYGSIIISWGHVKQSICQGHCVYSHPCYNKRSVVDSRKFEMICLFEESHCRPTFLKSLIYSTELVAVIFV